LAVVQVKNWITTPGRPAIPRGQVNKNLPLILQYLRWESCVTLDVPGKGMVGHLFFELRRAPQVEARRAIQLTLTASRLIADFASFVSF